MLKADAPHTFGHHQLRCSTFVIPVPATDGFLQEFGNNGKEAADAFERYTLPAVQRGLGAVRRGVLRRVQGTERSRTAGLSGAHASATGLLHSASVPVPVSETCRPSRRRWTATRRNTTAFCLVFRRRAQKQTRATQVGASTGGAAAAGIKGRHRARRIRTSCACVSRRRPQAPTRPSCRRCRPAAGAS